MKSHKRVEYGGRCVMEIIIIIPVAAVFAIGVIYSIARKLGLAR